MPQTDRSLAAGVIISPAGLPRTPLISNYDDIRLYGVKVIGRREGRVGGKGVLEKTQNSEIFVGVSPDFCLVNNFFKRPEAGFELTTFRPEG